MGVVEMKRLWILGIALLLVACVAPTQEIDYLHVSPTGTVTWNMPAEWLGQEILPGDVLTYEVYIYEWGTVADDQNIGALTLMGTVPAELYMIDLSALPDALYAIGVRAILTRDEIDNFSAVAWSYESEYVDPEFGTFLMTQTGTVEIGRPTGLRIGG
jgi:hypothetical protein